MVVWGTTLEISTSERSVDDEHAIDDEDAGKRRRLSRMGRNWTRLRRCCDTFRSKARSFANKVSAICDWFLRESRDIQCRQRVNECSNLARTGEFVVDADDADVFKAASVGVDGPNFVATTKQPLRIAHADAVAQSSTVCVTVACQTLLAHPLSKRGQ